MSRTIRAAAAALLLAAPAIAQDGEPVSLDAFSVWEGAGSIVETGPNAHVFAGEMRGPYFIDVGQGPVHAGEIACVGMLEADMETGRQTGAARCRLDALDGAASFGRFACEGFRLVGCAGVFELTGGEGRMAGATGEGAILIRRTETALVAPESGPVTELAIGVAVWRDFKVTLAKPAE
ncbi:MAG: hypothetical protein ACFCUS_13825 [Rubrimonas sp.]|uniref:hypothetical protein n=1 Tax=Rubrimonas sp. TaxID=2036015 RepID=UPI002FDE953C